MLINGKVVIIIGGAGLVGTAFCQSVLKHGAKLIIADINIDNLNKLNNYLVGEASEYKFELEQVDITSKNSIDRLIERVNSRHGRIDVVVNNAYPKNKSYGRKLQDVEYADFCENVSMHLGGYFLSTQRFSIFFSKQTFGHVINISSIYGIIAPRFEIYEGTSMTMPVEYAAIKSAIQHLTLYFMRFYKGTKLRFNNLALGGILDDQPIQFTENYKKFSNYKGMLDPKDVAGSLIYLISDYSEFVNGQNLIVDDGWSK